MFQSARRNMIFLGTVDRSQDCCATLYGASRTRTRRFSALRYSATLRFCALSFLALSSKAPLFQIRETSLPTLFLSVVGLLAFSIFAFVEPVIAAEDLTLRKGISFDEDTDTHFPIISKKTDDTKIEAGKPTIIFFGAAGDLNTNRQAKKVVSLYQKFKSKKLKFIIVDVDHPPNDDAKSLIKKFYKGYIPCQTILDKNGNLSWRSDGEVSEKQVSSKLDEQLKTI